MKLRDANRKSTTMISDKKRLGFSSYVACCLVILTFARGDFSFAKLIIELPPILKQFVEVLERKQFDTFVGEIQPNQVPERATVAMLGSVAKSASSLSSKFWAL